MSLQIKQLSYQLSQQQVLQDLSLQANAGETLVLIGGSELQQSTLLQSIAGVINGQNGEFYLNKKRFDPSSSKVSVALVMPEAGLIDHLSVVENIQIGLSSKQRKSASLPPLLSKLDLAGWEKAKPEQLTQFQQVKVALARALITNPDILLIDNIFSGAYELEKRARLQLVKQLLVPFQGISIVSAGNREEVFQLADEVAVIEQGEVIQQGSPENVYQLPVSLFAAQTLGEVSVLEGDVFAGRVRLDDAVFNINDYSEKLKSHLDIYQDRRLKLLVRPQNLQVHATANSHLKVIDNYFSGSESFLLVSDGQREMLVQNNDKQFLYEGDTVTLTVLPHKLVCV